MNLEAKLKTYIEKLKGQEGYFVRDVSTVDFFAKNPSNEKLENVRMKVNMISDTALSHALSAEDMAKHIYDLKIDIKLKANDLSLVEDIAHLVVRNEPKSFLRFASMYCNFHYPDVFPIFSEQHLDLYRNYIAENKLNINPEDLTKYSVFKTVLDDVLNRFDIKDQLNYYEARKLSWLYIDKIMHEH